jgi:outer membrane protein insertion porin family
LRSIYYIFITSISIIFLSGCSNTRHLKENEYLLDKQFIKGNKKVSNETLTSFMKQKPNRKILGLKVYLSIYYFGKSYYKPEKTKKEIEKTTQKYDEKIVKYETNIKKSTRIEDRKEKKLKRLHAKEKDGNWMMRVPGEAPSIFDSSLANTSLRQLILYYHSKSFFQAKISADYDSSRKKIRAKYLVKEGPTYTLKEVKINAEMDTALVSLVMANCKYSFLKIGENYDEEKINAERERLNKLLKDNGYFDFSRQFIFFQIDTTEEKQKVTIEIIIKDPPGFPKKHQKYIISKIIFNTDISNTNPQLKRDTAIYRDIHFVYFDKRFSKKILTYKIRISPGHLYNQSAVQNTQRQLAGLDNYKFININFEKNKNDTLTNTLTGFIQTSPLKKFQISDEFGLNVSQGWIPGPFGNLTFKERNTFKGFEILELGVRYSIMGQAAVLTPEIYKTEEYGANASLTFPQFFFPTRIRFKFYDYNPKTKIIAGYSVVNRPEYSRASTRAALNYTLSPNNYSLYTFAPVDLNIINTTRITSEFLNYLDDLAKKGNNLRNSFRKSFVSNMNFSYVYNNAEFGVNKKSTYFKVYLESGGTSLNLLNKILLKNADSIFHLKTFRYLKFTAELRRYYPVSKYNTFAVRFSFGISDAYTGTHSLPYEKYFFSGGSNSIRAWRPRRLGPGSAADRDPVTNEITYQFEKPGEMQFESNYEYRFKIISFLKGAFFVDAGNVWNIRQNASYPGGQFKFNTFFNQIAVGAGYGLRFDFSFLIFRLDLGTKIWDPGEYPGQKYVGKNLSLKNPWGKKGQSVLNIGIGYPF